MFDWFTEVDACRGTGDYDPPDYPDEEDFAEWCDLVDRCIENAQAGPVNGHYADERDTPGYEDVTIVPLARGVTPCG
jgi:hypothetical protein